MDYMLQAKAATLKANAEGTTEVVDALMSEVVALELKIDSLEDELEKAWRDLDTACELVLKAQAERQKREPKHIGKVVT